MEGRILIHIVTKAHLIALLYCHLLRQFARRRTLVLGGLLGAQFCHSLVLFAVLAAHEHPVVRKPRFESDGTIDELVLFDGGSMFLDLDVSLDGLALSPRSTFGNLIRSPIKCLGSGICSCQYTQGDFRGSQTHI